MSWGFWSDFLNSKEDYYPIRDNDEDIEFGKEAAKWENSHKKEAEMLEQIMYNPELAEKMKKLETE